jgi:biopolymer transport protein ExbB
MGAIAEAFRTGGIWMYIILAVSIVNIGIVIERFIFLFFKYSVNAGPFMAQIQKLVMANNIDRAIKLSRLA